MKKKINSKPDAGSVLFMSVKTGHGYRVMHGTLLSRVTGRGIVMYGGGADWSEVLQPGSCATACTVIRIANQRAMVQ